MVKSAVRRVLAGVLVIGGLAAPSGAHEKLVIADISSKTDALISAFMKTNGVPGCSAAVGSRGALDYAQGYGRARSSVPAKPDTIYRIGSLTKQFTAALALVAARDTARDRRLSLDARISDFFPRQRQWADITLRHLLTHTSGIPTYTATRQFRFLQFKPIADRKLLKMVQDYDQDYAPGSRGKYSNSNYLLLAHILKQRTGSSYADLLKTHIFDPLGMRDTRLITARRPGKRMAQGSLKGRFTNRRTHSSWTLGVGDLQSSVLDMAKWNMALFGRHLLSDHEKSEMFAASIVNEDAAVEGEKLAMGWMDISDGATRRYYHQGYLHGYSAINLVVDPNGQASRFVTILCNAHLVQGMPDLAIRISRLL